MIERRCSALRGCREAPQSCGQVPVDSEAVALMGLNGFPFSWLLVRLGWLGSGEDFLDFQYSKQNLS
jgi:hypothetical protein